MANQVPFTVSYMQDGQDGSLGWPGSNRVPTGKAGKIQKGEERPAPGCLVAIQKSFSGGRNRNM